MRLFVNAARLLTGHAMSCMAASVLSIAPVSVYAASVCAGPLACANPYLATVRTSGVRNADAVRSFLSGRSLRDSVAPPRLSEDSVAGLLGPRLGWSPLSLEEGSSDTSIASSPTQCVMAASIAEDRATQTAEAQAAQFIARPDTLPLAPQAVQVARTCGRRWTAENTPLVELPGLFRLALLAGEDDRAAAVGARWIQSAGPDVAARGEVLLRQIQWLADTRPRTPARRARIEQLLGQLNALGEGALEQRIDAVAYLQEYYGILGDLKQQLLGVGVIRDLVRQVPVARRARFAAEMLGAAIQLNTLFQMPFDLSSPALHTAVEQELAQARRDLADLDRQHQARIIIPTTFDAFMFTPELVRHDSLFVGLHVIPAPAVQAQHWYGRPDTTIAYPRRGALTFVLPTASCQAGENECAMVYAAWRRLYAEFAPRGVEFVLTTRTSGSFGLSTTLPAAAEVDSLRAYYREKLKLPGMLAIQESEFATLADGRKIAVSDGPAVIGIVTQDGLLWPFWDIGHITGYTWVERFIANQLAHPSAPPARRERAHSSSETMPVAAERTDSETVVATAALQSHVLLPVTVRGQTGSLALDVGSDTGWVFGPVLRALGIATSGQPVLDSLPFGTTLLHDVPVKELAFSVDNEPAPLIGVIGADVLSRYDLLFDGPARTVRVYAPPAHPSSWLPAGVSADACVPLEHDPQYPDRIFFSLQMNGRAIHSMFDSGSSSTNINLAGADALGITKRTPNLRLLPLGIGGQFMAYHGQKVWEVSSGLTMTVAGRPLTAVPIDIYQHLPREHGPSDPELSLGLDAIRDRMMFVSYSTHRVCLATVRNAGAGGAVEPVTSITPTVRLTNDAMSRMTAFWAAWMQLPPSVRDTARARYQQAILVSVSIDAPRIRLYPLVSVVDMPTLAAHEPAARAALAAAHLTAEEWSANRAALFAAILTDQTIALQAGLATPAMPPADVAANLAFLHAHADLLAALKATGMWFPRLAAFQGYSGDLKE